MLDSAQIQGALRKAVAAIIGFILAMVLLTALLITGFYLLIQAAVLALTPWLGQAEAMGLVGFGCVLLLALFFKRMTRPVSASKGEDGEAAKGASRSPVDVIRNLIRENPLEAALMAFAVGIAEQGDPRLKSLLLQGGMILMKRSEADESEDTSGGEAAEPNDETPPGQGTAA